MTVRDECRGSRWHKANAPLAVFLLARDADQHLNRDWGREKAGERGAVAVAFREDDRGSPAVHPRLIPRRGLRR